MINIKKSHELLFRDGTSQQDRKTDAIRPNYVPVEDRNMKELIAEAQRLAKEIRFFDANNEARPGQTWESFLIDDAATYNKESENGKKRKILRKQWASQLAAYVEDPEHFVKDPEKIAKLSRPHLVLFITFLKLLNHAKSQINGLTQKHLDFYFKECLGLTPKEAIPDVVNVLLELEKNIEYLEVKKGTVLKAGEDQSGNELHYTTDRDTVISQAQIAQLKNVFVAKQFLTIKDAHLNNKDTQDLGLTSMMEMALGYPNPGDPLPDFPNDEITDIFTLYTQVQEGKENAIGYVTKELFLTKEHFNLIFQKDQEEKEGIPANWQVVYDILDIAYKNRMRYKRQQQLRDIHKKEGFDIMLRQVYGTPLPGNELPLYKGGRASFDIVFDDLNSTDENAKKSYRVYRRRTKT